MSTYKEILKYDKFVKELNRKISDYRKLPNDLWNEDARQYVDGLASSELRQLVNIETRRKDGIFFTETKLAEKVFNFLTPPVVENMIVYDPACGAGNLLISIMNYVLEQEKGKKINLTFLGTDIHIPFIKASRARIKINALRLGAQNNLKMSFKCKSGFSKTKFYKEATHIVVNPPFNMCEVDSSCKWASGKVNNAALFIEKIIESVNPGTSICAILPDVLRSGSRYAKWRAIVNLHCTIDKFELFGQFDNYADVDIFAVRLTKRTASLLKDVVADRFDQTVKNDRKILLDDFDICVGPVVDNRDPKKGISRGYIVSKGLPNWSVFQSPTNFRKHKGKSFKSPFVVIKRTSRMGDKHRAIATIIKTKSPVYVDNHLIVLSPKSGLLSDCKKLLENLKNQRTDNWLNDAIRCRHLTVRIVSKIPIWV